GENGLSDNCKNGLGFAPGVLRCCTEIAGRSQTICRCCCRCFIPVRFPGRYSKRKTDTAPLQRGVFFARVGGNIASTTSCLIRTSGARLGTCVPVMIDIPMMFVCHGRSSSTEAGGRLRPPGRDVVASA